MINTAWSQDIELRVEVGLGLNNDSQLTLDDPTNGRLDYGILGSPDTPYYDITCEVRSLDWRSGATREDGVLTRWEAGTATIVMDADLLLEQDPTAPPRFLPMVPVRIRARLQPTDTFTYLFMGYADSWVLEWDRSASVSTLTLTASDGTKVLAAYNAPETLPAIGAGDTAAQRCSRILDESGWVGPRRIAAGGTIQQATTLAADTWTQLLLNQDTELGDTYVAQDGAVVFNPRNLWFDNATDPTVVAAWGPNDLRYEDVHITNDDANLRNIVDAARAGGAQVSARNDASVSQFLAHRWGRNDLMFANDADVVDWANVVLQTSSTPGTRVDQLEVLPQTDPANLWPVVLSTDYAQHWAVEVVNPGFPVASTNRNVVVRGWHHVVDEWSWRVFYTLSEALLYQAFILDGTTPTATLDVMRLI